MDSSEKEPLAAEEPIVKFTRKDEDVAEIAAQKTGDVEPFIETENPNSPNPERDTHNIVYLIILLHGIGTLMPWNMFINIAPRYYSEYKILERNETTGALEPNALSENFLSYMSLASQIPNLLLNLINIFITVRGDLTKRICMALSIVGVMIVFTMSFIYVDTWSWRISFTVLTLITIAILNSANGIYQNSVFGMATDLPFKYTTAVIIGNNLCGTFVAIVNIIAFSVMSDVRAAAFMYFSLALLCLVFCFISLFVLRRMPYYTYQKGMKAMMVPSNLQNVKITKKDYIDTFKQGWTSFINVFLVFFVTLTCFPGLMAEISDNGYGEPYTFIIPQDHFRNITCFLLFNVFAFIGSLFAGRYSIPRDKLWIPVYARLLFIPFFFFCNCRVARRMWPVLFPSTWLYVFMAIMMSLSSGYLSGLGMMYAPTSVDTNKQRIAGMMAGFFLILGIVSGLTFTIFVLFILTNFGIQAPPDAL